MNGSVACCCLKGRTLANTTPQSSVSEPLQRLPHEYTQDRAYTAPGGVREFRPWWHRDEASMQGGSRTSTSRVATHGIVTS